MKQAFELASPYIQSKFPLNNNVLKTLTLPWYNNWRNYHEKAKDSVIPEAEHDAFDLEVNKYHPDKNIPKQLMKMVPASGWIHGGLKCLILMATHICLKL